MGCKAFKGDNGGDLDSTVRYKWRVYKDQTLVAFKIYEKEKETGKFKYKICISLRLGNKSREDIITVTCVFYFVRFRRLIMKTCIALCDNILHYITLSSIA